MAETDHTPTWSRFKKTLAGKVVHGIWLGFTVVSTIGGVTALYGVTFEPKETAQILRVVATRVERDSGPVLRVNIDSLWQTIGGTDTGLALQFSNNSDREAIGDISISVYSMAGGTPALLYKGEREYLDISGGRVADGIYKEQVPGEISVCIHYFDLDTQDILRLRPETNSYNRIWYLYAKPVSLHEKDCDAAVKKAQGQ